MTSHNRLQHRLSHRFAHHPVLESAAAREARALETFAPVKVVTVDASDLPVIAATRADGERYSAAWILVLRDGAPCGAVELEFGDSDTIDPEELQRHVDQMPAPGRIVADVTDSDLPSISVLIPTNLTRPDALLPTLASLSVAPYPDVEIIVLDNRPVGGGEPLPQILEAYPGVRWVHEPRPGCDAARNTGVAAATGDVVAFTDDDVEVHPGWLMALGRRYASRPDEDAVMGMIVPQEFATPAQLWFERFYGGFASERSYEPLSFASEVSPDGTRRPWRIEATDSSGAVVRQFPLYGAGAIGAGANMTYRRSAVARFGGFDAALGSGTAARGGGDIASMMSLLWVGGRIGFEPAAMVYHQHRQTVAALEHQLHNYGIGATAVLSSLISRDPRHVAGIARQLPAAVRRRAAAGSRWHEGGVSAPALDETGLGRRLRLIELAGYPRGPAHYVASRIKARRWSG